MTMMALAEIKKQVGSGEVMARISNSLGKPATDPSVMKFISGAMMYIQSKVGQKGDVSQCTPQSIIDSLINAATVRLPVDNKHYACLIAYGNVCSFQPEWRGYVAKIKEADPSAVVVVGIVFKDDDFTSSKTDNSASFTHKSANEFEDDEKKITGAYCYIKTDTGSYLEKMSKKELDTVRSSSKVGYVYIWKDWTMEMYKKTIIRRACKVKFTEAVAELDALDNKMFNDISDGKPAPKIHKSIPLPKVQEAEVVPAEEGAGELSEEEMKAKTEEARQRKEQMEAEEKAQREAEAAGKTEKKNPPEIAEEFTAEGTVKAIIAPKGNSPYTKFTLRDVDGKFFATKDAATIEMLEAAKKSGARVKITYTETAWSGGVNQNIVKAEVLSGVSEELPY